MPPTAVHVKTDLTRLRLLGNGQVAPWSEGGAGAETIETLRARVTQAADWVATTLGGKSRLALVSIDVEECTCIWLRAISGEEPVLAATLRSAAQDWGDRFTSGTVQRLIDPIDRSTAETRKTGGGIAGMLKSVQKPMGKTPLPGPKATAVLSCPSSLVRLWLDELDVRGVRADMVCTLWHAAAAAWTDRAESSDVTAVILLDEPDRAVWSWSRGADLVCAGSVSFEHVAEAPPDSDAAAPDPASRLPASPAARAATRLGLDWLTWATQLGVTPARLVVVARNPAEFLAALQSRWPELPTAVHTAGDPVAETVSRAALAPTSGAARSPRRSLLSITHRPTRAVRTQYRWAAAALVVLAIGIAGLGARFGQASHAMAADAEVVRGESVGLVKSLNDPGLDTARNLVMTLRSKLVELRKREPPKMPPAPKPIYEEMQRLAEILAKFEGVRLVQVSLDSKQASKIQLQVPSRRVGEEIKLALQDGAGAVAWSEAGGSGSETQLSLNGNWNR